MLVVVSPAKRLDWDERPGIATTEPRFQADAARLARTAGRLSRADLRKLMSISADLAKLNQARFRAFEETPEAHLTRPSVLAFAGDTYLGLDAGSLDTASAEWAKDHLRILSGLYGVLQPFDAIQPYRLEMGSRLKTRRGGSLYAYWGPRIAETLNADAEEVGATTLINCASQEYFGAVDIAALRLNVVTPVFLEDRDGDARIVSFFAKRARGAMARFMIDNRIDRPEGILDFDLGGYVFDRQRSTPDRPVFIRPEAAQATAAE